MLKMIRPHLVTWLFFCLLLLSSTAFAAVPVISSFTSSRAAIGSDAPWATVFLNWSVSGATSLSIDQGVGTVTGSSSVQVHPTKTTIYTLTATNASGSSTATLQLNYIPLVQLDATHYQTEHALFIIPSAGQATFPDYSSVFSFSNIDNIYVPDLKARFPADYLMVVVTANNLSTNGAGQVFPVPIVTTRRHIAYGIGDDSITGVGVPNICRYNLGQGTVLTSAYAVFDHEIGHNWGARIGSEVTAGHWYPNGTVHGQMANNQYDASFTNAQQINGDLVNGFTWTSLNNLTLNETETFSDQDLYAMGLNPIYPDSYVLINPVFNPDNTMSYSAAAKYDHAWAVTKNGPRIPGYQTSEKQFRLGFVYIAKDFTDIQNAYYPIEESITQFENAESIDTVFYRFQVPFLLNSNNRASVNARLSDLDGNANPVINLTGASYVISTDGTAIIPFQASDPDGPAPSVSLLPASANGTIANNQVSFQGLALGSHFFTLKAQDALGKKAFTHFVIDVVTPGVYAFTPQIGLSPGNVATSNAVTVSGIANGTPVSIAGGSYAINGGAFTTNNGIINPGDTVVVKQTAPATYGASASATLLVGYNSGDFSVATANALSHLAVSTGTLTPLFAASTLSYNLSVPYATNSLAVTPTLADNTATVAVNGVNVASGSTSGGIPLAVGTNTITIVATAQNSAVQTYTLTVQRAKSSQSITMNTLNNMAYAPPFQVVANASSGLTVTLASTSPSVCTVSNSTVTLLGLGSCTLTADQSGDAQYLPAAQVSQTFTVSQAPTTTLLSSSDTTTLIGKPVTLQAQVTGGFNPTGTLSFYDGNTLFCNAVVLSNGGASCNVRSFSSGSHSLTTVYSGDANHAGSASVTVSQSAMAPLSGTCLDLPDQPTFKNALVAAQAQNNGGGEQVWGVLVDRADRVCAVAYSGASVGSQRLESRLRAVALASTANNFSTNSLFISSANLYQPIASGSLYGMENNLPMNAKRVYSGNFSAWGTPFDPLTGQIAGGFLALGGGLALMDAYGNNLGALGIAGSNPCADHNLAWRLRSALNLDYVPAGLNADDATRPDNILYQGLTTSPAAVFYTHPVCNNAAQQVSGALPVAR